MGREEFWEAVHERWSAADRKNEEDAVRSVLTHFAWRLPGEEATHVEEELPADLKELWPPDERYKRPAPQRPREKLDFEHFIRKIAEEACLSEDEAMAATRGVFHALGRFLTEEERFHISTQLPAGLKDLWDEETGG